MTARTTVAWFHCFSGIAGDMALGALVDAGADPDEVRSLLGDALPVAGWELDAEPVLRAGIAATQATSRPTGRPASCAPPPTSPAWSTRPVCPNGCGPGARHLHGAGRGRGPAPPPAAEQVHFHEVGRPRRHRRRRRHVPRARGARRRRGAGQPRGHRHGMVRSAHGCSPTPRPRSSSCCAGAPTYGVDVPLELTTPTGAALLAALSPAGGRCRP